MPYTPNSTWVDGAGGGTPLSAARFNNMEAGIGWTYDTYTPTWTATGTAPAIGDASVAAFYVQRGKFVHAQVRIVFGSSSTYGTGSYRFALPVSAVGGIGVVGMARLFDGSTGNAVIAACALNTASVIAIQYAATYLGANQEVGQTSPWTWAQNDQIDLNMVYRAA